jgi:hypothetical protein
MTNLFRPQLVEAIVAQKQVMQNCTCPNCVVNLLNVLFEIFVVILNRMGQNFESHFQYPKATLDILNESN